VVAPGRRGWLNAASHAILWRALPPAAPDALNRLDLPADPAMHVLQPNQTLIATVRLCPTGEARASIAQRA
jgi:hypothetical protein